MNIKICGLTTLLDTQYCAQQNPWALGFNFYPDSPRYISPDLAQTLIQSVPKSILKVGVYVNTTYDQLLSDMEQLELDLVQIYSPLNSAPNTFKERVILSLTASTTNDLPPPSTLKSYGYLLLDAPKIDHMLPGGTGRTANWSLAANMAKDYRLILAGGLNPQNVKQATELVNPFAIDLASGLEIAPGIKSREKIHHLFKELHHDN